MHTDTDTQQRILDSASELIHARSYADVGVSAICEHAGVKKGSFYHFFHSKRELTLTVLDTYITNLKRELMEKAFSPSFPPMQRLERFGQLMYEVQKASVERTGRLVGCPFGNLAVELSTQDELIRQKLAEIFAELCTEFKHALDEAVVEVDGAACELDPAAGGEAEPVDTAATAEAMVAYFEGVMVMAKTQNDPEVLRQLLPHLTAIRMYPADALAS